MAMLLSPSLPFLSPLITSFSDRNFSNHLLSHPSQSVSNQPWRRSKVSASSSDVCAPREPFLIDKSALIFHEAVSDDELWAAACLRVATFNEFTLESVRIEDHKLHLVEGEFETLQERLAGKREGFRNSSCMNASIPLSHLSSSSADLCAACKFTSHDGHRVVVGSLDLIQCFPDKIIGIKPQGVQADLAMAFLSDVCVAKELHRNGLGYGLVSKAKSVAEGWGITDLYVHVAVDNEPAQKLYMKSGFTFASDEPAWQGRFLTRPQEILLWCGLSDLKNS